jgi:hypothetical protein
MLRKARLIAAAALEYIVMEVALPILVLININDNCLSNVLVGYALLWEVRHAPTGEPS